MQVLGAIICGLVGVRLIQSIVASVQTVSIREASAARSLSLLDEQIATAKAKRIRLEQQHLHWNGYRKFRVVRRQEEAAGTLSLYLAPHDEKPLPIYQPGQYLTFRFQLPGGKASEVVPVVRCYSLSDAPHADHFRITVKRVLPPNSEDPPGRVSNHIHDHVSVGDILDVQAPRGEFYLDPNGTTPVVLVGGGVGVTPVLSMLNTVVLAESSRPVWFFYAVRNSADHMMKGHLQDLASAHSNINLFVCYSSPVESDVCGDGFDKVGYLDVDMLKDVLGVPNFDFYICGPPPMMSSLVPALQAWGVPKDRIHTEAFGPAAQKSAAPNTSAVSQKMAVKATVKFTRTGKEVAWDTSMGSLLDLALENGVVIDSGCRAGSCGTCLVAVGKGETALLGDADAECAAGSCLTCVSIPAGDVELDA